MTIIPHFDQPLEEWRAGVSTRMLVSATNGATQLCIFEQWIAPTAGVRTHHHPVEEVLTILNGEAEMWLDDEHSVLTAGHSLLVPAGRKHGFRNIRSETLHIQATLASAVFEASFDSDVVRRWEISN